MPALVLVDASVVIDSIDTGDGQGASNRTLSGQVRTVTLNYSVELLDASAMGVGATRSRVAGLLDWTVSIEFNQDFADDGIDEVMYAMLTGKTAKTIHIKPTSGAISASNPDYTGLVFLESYSPFSGGVAEIAVVSANLQGSGVLTRDITP